MERAKLATPIPAHPTPRWFAHYLRRLACTYALLTALVADLLQAAEQIEAASYWVEGDPLPTDFPELLTMGERAQFIRRFGPLLGVAGGAAKLLPAHRPPASKPMKIDIDHAQALDAAEGLAPPAPARAVIMPRRPITQAPGPAAPAARPIIARRPLAPSAPLKKGLFE